MASKYKILVKLETKKNSHFQKGDPLMLADFQRLNVQMFIDFDRQN